MPIYSHSQLSVYEECPLKFKLQYLDKVERETVEGVEGFLGKMVHEALKKCYDDAKLTKVNSLPDLLSYYDDIWQKNWQDSLVISKQDLTQGHYQGLGRKMIETYYQRYAPFSSDITIGTEMFIQFSLDNNNKYRLRGYIDRLSCNKKGLYQIHDYKTSASLPGQGELDRDRQLALYQIGVQKKWPDIKNIRLVWHYLAFDKEMASTRSSQEIFRLRKDVIKLIDEIESREEFPPVESGFCEWCEYPDLCPRRKHFFKVEALPANEYLKEPGVALVNRYAELKAKADEIAAEREKVKEAIISYAKQEGAEVIKGSGHKVNVKFGEKLKFPGKNEEEREQLVGKIMEAGKWMEVSELDTAALTRVVEEGLWDEKLIDEVLKFGWIEESSFVRLSKLKEMDME